ncbi:hypothetical protein QQ045_011133 [Rhodiola kirilowii]
MYNRCVPEKSYCNESFLLGVREFIQLAISRCGYSGGNRIRCPCRKCKNKKHHEVGVVETHLYNSGFTANYYNWTYHGEDLAHVEYSQASQFDQIPQNVSVDHQYSAYVDLLISPVIDQETVDSQFQNMIADVAGPSWDVPNNASTLPHEPNEIARKFYNLFKSSCDPAYEGCTTETELSMHMKLLQTKTDYNLSEAAYNSICQIIQSLADSNNRLPKSFSQSKKFVKDLDMGYTRIDVCENGCMIYYAEFESLTVCPFCDESRYHTPSRASSSSNYVREIILKRFPNCLDMYKRLKVGKDGTYFDINGAEIEAQLEAALRALQENGQAITEAEDLEASAPILGYSQRTGLPFVVGHAATMVPGSRFQSISSQENVTSQSTSQSFGLSQDTIALVTQMAHQFEDLRAVVAEQAQQLHYLQHGKSTTPSGSLDDDEVSSDEDSD